MTSREKQPLTLTEEEMTRAQALAKEARPLAEDLWLEFINEVRHYLPTDDLILLEKWTRARWSDKSKWNGHNVIELDLMRGSDDRRVAELLWEYKCVWRGDLSVRIDAFDWGELWEVEKEALEPPTRAVAPVVEFLEEDPREIRRPLSFIDGVAYAAIWPWVRVEKAETINKKGKVVRHNPPVVTKERHLVIIRDDGARFSDLEAVGMPSFTDLGLDVRLPEIPRTDKLWSTTGMLRYLEGYRPERMDVFTRVADVVDRFIDFVHSLADQGTMAELVALYILMTYFLPAFQVAGYLWPNGERGSGKTQLLMLVCELAYLGSVILAGSTYPTLRDLADYGATLAFDDAESVMDKKANPDKRTLLLAGNRRGAMIAVKEQIARGEWRTRQIDAFCPRLFSAIKLPDPVLGSRTIVIPLLRTLDRDKGNADPLDSTLWPHNRRTLLDDLWALALTHLSELPKADRKVAEQATLTGRALDPWRAILAVALWLSEDLFTKMDKLSVTYQQERHEMETTDLPVLCVQAMVDLAEEKKGWDMRDVKDNRDNSIVTYDCLTFSVSELSEVITRLAKEMDRHSGDEPFATVQRIGYTLTRLRVPNKRETGGQRQRYREIDRDELQRLAYTYAIVVPHVPSCPSCPPDSGNNLNDPVVQFGEALGGEVRNVVRVDLRGGAGAVEIGWSGDEEHSHEPTVGKETGRSGCSRPDQARSPDC